MPVHRIVVCAAAAAAVIALGGCSRGGDDVARQAAEDYVLSLTSGDEAGFNRLSQGASVSITDESGDRELDTSSEMREYVFGSSDELSVDRVELKAVSDAAGEEALLGQLGDADMGETHAYNAVVRLSDGVSRRLYVDVWIPPGKSPHVSAEPAE